MTSASPTSSTVGAEVSGVHQSHSHKPLTRTFGRGEAFRLAMLDAGDLLPPYVITDARINLAFTEDDVDETVEAASNALRLLA
jgi:hypothetical protein